MVGNQEISLEIAMKMQPSPALNGDKSDLMVAIRTNITGMLLV